MSMMKQRFNNSKTNNETLMSHSLNDGHGLGVDVPLQF